jgi:hypothetical protein
MRVVVTTPSGAGDGAQLAIRVAGVQDTVASADLARDEDWAYWDTLLHGTGANVWNPEPTGGVVCEGWNIDLKSKRKCTELGQSWFLYSRGIFSGTTKSISIHARTLVALP